MGRNGSSVGNNLHKLTATHALRSGYLSVQDESLRLLILLQAACFSRRFSLDESPWALMDTVKPSRRPTLGSPAEVFDALDRTRPEPGPNGHAADEAPDFNTQHRAAADLMALLAADPSAFEVFVTETSDILREKAVAAHEYKYPYAIFVDASLDGPAPWSLQELEPVHRAQFSTHLLDPASVLGLAHGVFGSRTRGFLLGIRGYEFNQYEERISSGGRVHLLDAVRFLREVVERQDVDLLESQTSRV